MADEDCTMGEPRNAPIVLQLCLLVCVCLLSRVRRCDPVLSKRLFTPMCLLSNAFSCVRTGGSSKSPG
jgi:hypothetical protein